MTHALRSYQRALVILARDAYRAGHRSICLQTPTGGGKTPMAAYMIRAAAERRKRVLFAVHRNELVEQASAHMTQWGVPHGLIMGGVRRTYEPVQVASLQTLARRPIEPYDFIVLDEGHHGQSKTWRNFMSQQRQARFMFITATPSGMTGNKGLGDVCDYLICGPQPRWLMDNGYLCPARVFSPGLVDVSNLRRERGDFRRDDVDALVNRREIVGDVIEHYRLICDHAPAMVFCASVAHAEFMADEFNRAGYRAASVDGKLPREEQRRRINGLRTGDFELLMSCDLVGEGVDIPGVVAVIETRPTDSLVIHLQHLGRGLRTAPGKDCAYILDHIGNCYRKGERVHGLPDEDRHWDLVSGVDHEKDAETIPRIRQCDRCYHVHMWGPQCPECGRVYPLESRPAPTQVDGSLEEITPEKIAELQREVATTGSLKAHHALAKAEGRKPGSAWMQYKLSRRRRAKLAIGERA